VCSSDLTLLAGTVPVGRSGSRSAPACNTAPVNGATPSGAMKAPDPTALKSLEEQLRLEIRGEVHFDAAMRAIYATDASPYELIPYGVVLPLDEDDVRAAVRIAVENGVPVL